MKNLFLVFSLLSLITNLDASSLNNDHQNDLKNQMDNIWQETKKEYLVLDPDYQEKSEWHRPRFVQQNQKKELVYILHGFMGTPFEMKIFEQKALEEGYDVYNDLIFGYGDQAKLVNQTKNGQWMELFNRKLDLLLPHYDKIHFVGFSTGGLMISHMIFDRQNNIGSKIGEITLISPFYEPDMFAARFLLNIVSFFINTLPSDLPYNLIRYPDVVVMINHPENFMQQIPLPAAKQVMDLADKFTEKAQNSLGNFPQMTVYMTPNDRVADYEFTKKYLPKIFTGLSFVTLEGQKAPHHLMVESVSEHTILLKNEFLKKRN